MIGKDAIDARSRDDGSSDRSERENNDNVLLTTPSSAKVVHQKKAFDFVNVAGFDDDGDDVPLTLPALPAPCCPGDAIAI